MDIAWYSAGNVKLNTQYQEADIPRLGYYTSAQTQGAFQFFFRL